MAYRTSPLETEKMPPGIPHIIGNEAAERFSFYGMKTILVIFMTQYLWLMDKQAGVRMTQVEANQVYHFWGAAVYFTPLIGALISDLLFGKYNVIMWLSLVYCAGHGALALMGLTGDPTMWLYIGLGMIAVGAGGIKPCVSAHVGDQFGSKNQGLLVRVFNWFYFSINLGSFLSTAMTPWVLEHYGPHWAFGIPGALMALATLVFWMGRKHFAHVPAKPKPFLKELLSREGRIAIAKLLPVVAYVSVFWALFDQTSSAWVFQAQDMDLSVPGLENPILPSQIQSINPVLVLILIPLFSYVVYPAIDRVWKLTPLRKIGIGLFLAAGAFTIPSLVQEWIANGERPHFSWHLLAFLLLTMAEVMVSVVGLEFFYTQSPVRMKSVVMSLWLLSVFLGNKLIEFVNHEIEVPTAVEKRSQNARESVAGLDGKMGTADDITVVYEDGAMNDLEFASKDVFVAAALEVEALADSKGALPSNEEGMALVASMKDEWGNGLEYQLQNSKQARIRSAGPDGEDLTQWDLGVLVTTKEDVGKDKAEEDLTWLEKRKIALGVVEARNENGGSNYNRAYFVGGSQGMTTMEGASYFWFFTWLMLGTAVLFVPFAYVYKPKVYLPTAIESDPGELSDSLK